MQAELIRSNDYLNKMISTSSSKIEKFYLVQVQRHDAANTISFQTIRSICSYGVVRRALEIQTYGKSSVVVSTRCIKTPSTL